MFTLSGAEDGNKHSCRRVTPRETLTVSPQQQGQGFVCYTAARAGSAVLPVAFR